MASKTLTRKQQRGSKSGTSHEPHPPKQNPVNADGKHASEGGHGVQKEFPQSPWTHKVIMGIAVVLPFLAFLTAIVWSFQNGFMGWTHLALLVGGWALTGQGITIGFHRLLTHRSFDTYGWVRMCWMALGALSVEGSPLTWCAVHRRHHELSDQIGDPHSPHVHGEGVWNSLRGLWYAHTGWLFTGYWSNPDMQRYIPDLLAERTLVAVDRLYYVWVLLSLGIPALIAGLISQSVQGALLGLFWGGLVRIFITHHVTWSINSICHVFGQREFESADDSRNNALFGILSFGEGWHNNHHAFPTSARHGLRWWQLDTSWLIIRTMQALGLAWNVKLPTEKQMLAKRLVSQES
ncbi:MAG: acyl-CoA desaturase [Planctomycetaceae bacterium]